MPGRREMPNFLMIGKKAGLPSTRGFQRGVEGGNELQYNNPLMMVSTVLVISLPDELVTESLEPRQKPKTHKTARTAQHNSSRRHDVASS